MNENDRSKAPAGRKRNRAAAFTVTVIALACFGAIVWKSCSMYWTVTTLNSGEVHYAPSISSEEADSLAKFLLAEGIFDGNKKTVRLARNSGVVVISFVVRNGAETEPGVIANFEAIASRMSQRVFRKEDILINLCNSDFEPLKRIEYRRAS